MTSPAPPTPPSALAIPSVHTLDALTDSVSAKGPTFVTFGAAWCGACKSMQPTVHKLHAAAGSAVRFLHVDIDECDGANRKHRVSSMPCYIVFRDGKELGRKVGSCTMTELVALLRPL